MSVENHLKNLSEKISEACHRSQRDPDSVQLVAVSKMQPVAKIIEALQCGQKIFGENYVQEILPKMDQLENASIEWHFIGPLQSNKARKIVGRCELIHSVDRLSLMEEISRQCEIKSCEQKVLLQLNLAGEESKSGTQEGEAEILITKGLQLPGVKICGLMTMPPFSASGEQSRPFFTRLNHLFEDFKSRFFKDERLFSHLSMGTSQDFEVAIEEGATLIRVGTQVFGQRDVL